MARWSDLTGKGQRRQKGSDLAAIPALTPGRLVLAGEIAIYCFFLLRLLVVHPPAPPSRNPTPRLSQPSVPAA